MTKYELIEKVAAAMWSGAYSEPWGSADLPLRGLYIRFATVALDAFEKAQEEMPWSRTHVSHDIALEAARIAEKAWMEGMEYGVNYDAGDYEVAPEPIENPYSRLLTDLRNTIGV